MEKVSSILADFRLNFGEDQKSVKLSARDKCGKSIELVDSLLLCSQSGFEVIRRSQTSLKIGLSAVRKCSKPIFRLLELHRLKILTLLKQQIDQFLSPSLDSLLKLSTDESRDVRQASADALNRLTGFLPETLLTKLRYLLFRLLQHTGTV